MGIEQPAAGEGLGLSPLALRNRMAFGNWIEERQFAHPADIVYETLVALLARSRLHIDSWDASKRGVVAVGLLAFLLPFVAIHHTRVAAAVRADGEQASVVIIESGPAYAPVLFGEYLHRRHVRRLLTILAKALEEPNE
jgi:hypothetical protein